MKLNHINLYSRDIAADRAMFARYFGLRTLVVRGEAMAVMEDDDGLVLILNHFESRLNGFAYPAEMDIFHVGFIMESREAVDALHARLSADGWGPRAPHVFHGAWAFCFQAVGGYFIEVTTRTPVRPQEAWPDAGQGPA